MNEKDYKRTNKPPACTTAPWKMLIPFKQRFEVMHKIKQECLDEYGMSLLECPKRLTCFSKTCLGRPLPWKSKTALPYLKEFARINGLNEGDDYYIKDCDSCPIKATCTSTCMQINDFIDRDRSREVSLTYKESVDEYLTDNEEIGVITSILEQGLEVPWDCLNDTRKQVVYLYLYKGLDFAHIATKLDLNNQARVKYEFYAGLTKLSEYAVMRKFYHSETGQKLKPESRSLLLNRYLNNYKFDKIAEIYKVSKQAVQQRLNRIIKNNNLKWHTFVYKKDNKVIYNTKEVVK